MGITSRYNALSQMAKICRVIRSKIESVSLRKCPYDHRVSSKAYLSAITVTNISQSFYLEDGAWQKSTGVDKERNHVTVTCV